MSESNTAATATDDTATAVTATDTDQAAASGDLAAEVAKWKASSRKYEDRARSNAEKAKRAEELESKLAEYENANKSELEKAVESARKEGFTEALKAHSARLVDAEVRAAAAGRSIDVDALLDGLDRSRFVLDDGEVDSAAIVKFIERIAPKSYGPVRLDIGQGERGSSAAQIRNPLEAVLKNKLGIPI